MARITNEQEYAKKRNEILDAAQRLIYTKGYERLTIRDILADLNISGGAFYHYFNSKQEVAVAMAERMQDGLEQDILPVVKDGQLSAAEKLQRAMAILLRRDIAGSAEVLIIALLRVWFSDENALVRAKVDDARAARFAPLLTEIVDQGMRDGSFTIARSELSGEFLLSLIQGLQYSLASCYFVFEKDGDRQRFIEGSVTAFDAYMGAIERAVGGNTGLILRLDAETVSQGLAINDEIAANLRKEKSDEN